MRDVFVYQDNSNIFHEAQRLAEDRNAPPERSIECGFISTTC